MAPQTEIAQLYYTLGARVDASTQSAVAQQSTALDELAQVAEQAGVPLGSLQAAVEQLVDEVEGELKAAVQKMGKEMDAAGISAAVLAEQTEAVAEASAQSLGALSAQVRLYAQGTQIAATRQQSLTQLAAIEQLLKGRLDQGNLTLEQRIRLQQVLAQTQAATALATARASEAVKAFGDRWSGTALNIVTAASSIVQSGNVSSGGLKSVLLGATQLAGFLGAGGALVVAAGVAANAIISVFTKARDEAKKTVDEAQQEITRLQNAGDFAALTQRAREAFLGTASEGYQDGVRGLTERLAALDAQIESSGVFGKLDKKTKAERAALQTLLDRKTAEYNAARKALENIAEPGRAAPLPIRVTAPGTSSGGVASPVDTRALDEANRKLDELAKRAEDANRAIGAALRKADRELATIAGDTATVLRQQIDETVREFTRLGASDAEIARIVAPLRAALDAATALNGAAARISINPASLQQLNTFSTGAKGAKGNTDALRLSVEDLATSALGIATGFAGANDSVTRMIAGASQLAASFSRIAELAKSVGGLGALFSSGAGIAAALPAIGGIIGGIGAIASQLRESPEQREARELLRRNNERLEALRTTLGDAMKLTSSGRAIAGVGQALTAAGVPTADTSSATRALASTLLVLPKVSQELKKLGLSLEDVRRIARDAGIEVSDVPTLKQLQQVAQYLRDLDFNAFANSFAGDLQRLDAEFEIFSERFQASADRFRAVVEALNGPNGAPALFGALRGLDTATKAGRATALEEIQRLFRLYDEGKLTAEDLNGLSPEQFFETLKRLKREIEDLPADPTPVERFAKALELLGVQLEFGTLTLEQRLERAKQAFAQLFPELAASIDTSSAEAFRESIKAIIDGFAADGDLSEAERAQIEVLRALLAAFKDVTDAAEAAADAAREQAEAEEEKRRRDSEEADRKAKEAADAAAAAEEKRRQRVLALAEAYIRANDITDPVEILRIRLKALGDAFPALRAQLELFDVSTEEGRKALEAFVQLLIDTPENLTALADALGISVDELTQMLLDLEEGADSAAAAVATLAARLQVAFDDINFALALDNVTDPIERLRRTAAGLAGILPDLDAALAGLDLSSEFGRAQAEARLIALAKSSTDAAVRDAVLQLLQQIRGIRPGDGSGVAPSFGRAGAGNGEVRFGAFATGTVVQFDRIITILTDIEANTRTLALGAPRGSGVRAPVLPQVPSAVVTTSLAGASGAAMVVNVYATINIGAGVSPETARVALDEGGERIRRQVEDVVETGGARRLLRSQRARRIPLQT